MRNCTPGGRGQRHVTHFYVHFYILDLEDFVTASRWCIGEVNKTPQIRPTPTTVDRVMADNAGTESREYGGSMRPSFTHVADLLFSCNRSHAVNPDDPSRSRQRVIPEIS